MAHKPKTFHTRVYGPPKRKRKKKAPGHPHILVPPRHRITIEPQELVDKLFPQENLERIFGSRADRKYVAQTSSQPPVIEKQDPPWYKRWWAAVKRWANAVPEKTE
jgi:hypothetical protein